MSKKTFIFILVLLDIALFFLPKKLRLQSIMMNALVDEVPFGKAIVKFLSSAYLFFAKVVKIPFYILTIILIFLFLSYLFKFISRKMKKEKTNNNGEFTNNSGVSNSGGESRKDTTGMNYF